MLLLNIVAHPTDELVLTTCIVVTHETAIKPEITWAVMEDESHKDAFAVLLTRAQSILLESTQSHARRTWALTFLIRCISSLEVATIRQSIAPLMSIGIWENVYSETKRDEKISGSSQLRKAWRIAEKKKTTAEATADGKQKVAYERKWLYSLLCDALNLFEETESTISSVRYLEFLLEFLIAILSQLPTRRYTNFLLEDLHFAVVVERSQAFKESNVVRKLFGMLEHYIRFGVDDITGESLTPLQQRQRHDEDLKTLQYISFEHFKDNLIILALSNYGSIESSADLKDHFGNLSDDELSALCKHLNIRTEYDFPSRSRDNAPCVKVDKAFLVECLVYKYAKQEFPLERALKHRILPTEVDLFDPMIQRIGASSNITSIYEVGPTTLPKLGLHYLSVEDFLWRAFQLCFNESILAIQKDVEASLAKLAPYRSFKAPHPTLFDGLSSMAVRIEKPAILEVMPPLVGEEQPRQVVTDLMLNFEGLPPQMRRAWDSLRTDELVFIGSVHIADSESNGTATEDPLRKLGLESLRAAKIVNLLSDDGRPLQVAAELDWERFKTPNRRLLRVHLDPMQYYSDEKNGKLEVYGNMNVVFRRNAAENNFTPLLQSIKDLLLKPAALPEWYRDTFLGIGDPAAASWPNLSESSDITLDFGDTFVDKEHVLASFSQPVTVRTNETVSNSQWTLSISDSEIEADLSERQSIGQNGVLNTVRFTQEQVSAINQSLRPGLSLIAGAPATGKSQVLLQILKCLYHNFPGEKVLIICKSNVALGRILDDIGESSIEHRHILRAGHGSSASSGNNIGRLEFFDNRRAWLLSEVNRLARSLNIPGDYGNSCETASYFYRQQIEPRWHKFKTLQNTGADFSKIAATFPFTSYVAPTKDSLPVSSMTTFWKFADAHYASVVNMFTELDELRPFELLLRNKERFNYLLTKQAKIIGMTSTQAYMRRRELVEIGFHYDTLILDDAVQINEVESFIPMVLGRGDQIRNSLQRIVLLGNPDDTSHSVQLPGLRDLEQTLFHRLLRLGVPSIRLNAQGRCRSSIADLYRWRYDDLEDIPYVQQQQSFQNANAGSVFVGMIIR